MQDEASEIADEGPSRQAASRRVRPTDPTTALPGQVRRLRQARGWTLDTLATASDVSRSMLSQIERGEANPTLAVAFRIARAFGITLDALVEASASAGTIDVIRSDDPSSYYRNDLDCTIRTLSPLRLQKEAELYHMTLAPGFILASAPHATGTRELLSVQHGEVRVRSGTDEQVLQAGDSAYYPADVEHSIANVGTEQATVILLDMYRD
jgi:transcriptional regulator with XRE-family HTH domain